MIYLLIPCNNKKRITQNISIHNLNKSYRKVVAKHLYFKQQPLANIARKKQKFYLNKPKVILSAPIDEKVQMLS